MNNEEVFTTDWSGENNKSAREEAAKNIAQQIIDWHKDNPDDPIRLVGHSHGG